MNDEKRDPLLDLIVSELREIGKELKEQGKIQAAQQEILRDHTNRSTRNEELIQLVEEKNDRALAVLNEKLDPALKYVDRVNTILGVSGAVAGVCAFLLVIIQIVQFFTGK